MEVANPEYLFSMTLLHARRVGRRKGHARVARSGPASGGTRGARQGLTLVHFSAQPEPLLLLKLHEITHFVTYQVLTTSRHVDECKYTCRP